MRRRVLLASTVATTLSPGMLRAQQKAMPVIGYLSPFSAASSVSSVTGFRRGLNESGFIDGKNVTIDHRWAEGQYDRLPGLAADLVDRRAAVIFSAGGPDSARAAKAATVTIPIVFFTADDPVGTGLVASLNRPGGNVTGVTMIGSSLDAKRLELLHELLPKAATIAVIINTNYPAAQTQSQEVQAAAALLGVKPIVLAASTERDLDTAFAALARQKADALLVSEDPFLASRREQLVALALRHAVPAIYPQRAFVVSWGLASYGPDFADGYRQAGVYVARILKGTKPADLPVMQPTKFELIINLRTAKALGLTIPPSILTRADEVIE